MTFTITAPLVSWLFIAVVAIEAVLLAAVIKAVMELMDSRKKVEKRLNDMQTNHADNTDELWHALAGKANARKSRKKKVPSIGEFDPPEHISDNRCIPDDEGGL